MTDTHLPNRQSLRRAASRLVALVAGISVTLVGCSHPGAPVLPTLSATLAPADMTHDQLLDLAIDQYRHLFDILSDVEFKGGASILPSSTFQYLTDPAWSVINQSYIDMHVSGVRYASSAQASITAVAEWIDGEAPDDTLIAVQACELTVNATKTLPDGSILHDGSSVLMHREGYFKTDPRDGKLKIFILNGEPQATCPIQ